MGSRWEWALPDGRRVAAAIDDEGTRERVWIGGRLASEAARGAHPEGHVVGDVIVLFEAHAPICVLRLDGHEIAPAIWPGRGTGAAPALATGPRPTVTPSEGLPRSLVVLALVAALLVGVALASRALRKDEPDVTQASFRAHAGFFVARYPSTFVAHAAAAPNGGEAVRLERADADENVVVLAMPLGDAARDPWLVHKRLHPEVLAELPRADKSFDETARSEETCLGEKGAVVVGRTATAHGASAKVWSCAFVHDDLAFVVAYAVREGAPAAEEAALRAVVDATDLTRLGETPGADKAR